MGRIKTTFAKRKTKELFKKHGSHFSTEYDGNKKTVDMYTIIKCKKIRNIIAGYMTRLKKVED
ncbi:30S ribosomal protein S17e [Candidatus Woesearchaeota archaeon CG10_big_fil_rev_8_21_14_0_10_32_24]|nr:MAG: 30S ribosomal protein S17e [Candidatus Woesearchaeota archaeon CG10_big_fil_rev_8_21_14_0_10_32_24]